MVRLKSTPIQHDSLQEIESIQTIAAYKTLKNGVVKLESRYYHSPRYAAGTERRPLPQSITIEHLYKALISILLRSETGAQLKGIENQGLANTGYSLEKQIAQEEERRKLIQTIERIQKHINKEKQFNKRVELNIELKKMQAKLRTLF